MQTFLPYSDFRESASVLDYRRLGKQRIEAAQILASLGVRVKKVDGNFYKPTHKNHPCIKIWQGYENALKYYYNCIVEEWVTRGYKNNMELFEVDNFELPPLIGREDYHNSHKSNLLRKFPEHYNNYNWKVSTNLDYVWK